MKYSVPGHSCIQEIDNTHSQIERSMKNLDVWSPLSFVRVLLQVNRKKPFRVLQLTQKYFKNYHKISKYFKYNSIPFTSIAQLLFRKIELFIIGIKTCHGFKEFQNINISHTNIISNLVAENILKSLEECIPSLILKMTEDKIKDVQSLYKLMAPNDGDF